MIDKDKIRKAMLLMIEAIGENPEREGLAGTPDRVARMYEEIFSGIDKDPKEYLQVFFNEDHDEMILIKDIPFYSMCEHHFLPFVGKAHVAYIPSGGKVVGISKLARVVDLVAKRPQLQERLTNTIANTLMDCLSPQGVAVVVEAEHFCMSMRGIKKPGSRTVTSAVRGIFKTDARTRSEVLALMKDK